jgi:hypothetical protein
MLFAAAIGGRSPWRKADGNALPRRVLKLPDLEQSKSAVLNRLTSTSSKRSYDHAIREFIDWYCSEPRLAFNRTVVTRYRSALEQYPYAPSTINLRLAAIRRLAYEASDRGLLSPDLAAGIRRSERSPAPGSSCRKLANGGRRQEVAECGKRQHAAQPAQSCSALTSDRLWAPKGRSNNIAVRGFSASGRPLGHRGPERKGWTHSDHSRSRVGKASG